MSRSPRMLSRAVVAATAAAVIGAAVAVRARRHSSTAPSAALPEPPPVPEPENTPSPAEDAPAPSPPRGRRLRWLLGVLLAVAVIGTCTAAALMLKVPDWARWTPPSLALAVAAILAIAFLIGPAARRLAGETAPLTAAERQEMSATERVEAVNAARNTLMQVATTLAVLSGAGFTLVSFRFTADSLETSRQAQLTAEQGQITDRYTKAVEQLGSAKQDVRLGGIYALQRLAADSPRDRDTIRNVLAAYVRDHDLCTPPDNKSKPPIQCADTPRARAVIAADSPGADVLAALTIAPTLTTAGGDSVGSGLADFSQVRFPRAVLEGVDLSGANLTRANLYGAFMSYAKLGGVYLGDADLRVQSWAARTWAARTCERCGG